MSEHSDGGVPTGWRLLGTALWDQRPRSGAPGARADVEPVWVRNDLGGRDPLDPAHFFRGLADLPLVEREALDRLAEIPVLRGREPSTLRVEPILDLLKGAYHPGAVHTFVELGAYNAVAVLAGMGAFEGRDQVKGLLRDGAHLAKPQVLAQVQNGADVQQAD